MRFFSLDYGFPFLCISGMLLAFVDTAYHVVRTRDFTDLDVITSVRTSTLTGCYLQCGKTHGCKDVYFESNMDENQKRCFLLKKTEPKTNCHSGDESLSSKEKMPFKCVVVKGSSKIKNPIQNLTNIKTWQSCGVKCHQHKTCEQWTYEVASEKCFLQLKGPYSNQLGFVAGNLHCYDTDHSHFCFMEKKTRYSGEVISEEIFPGWPLSKQCANRCREVAGCNYWTYLAKSKRCVMMRDKGNISSENGWTSGNAPCFI